MDINNIEKLESSFLGLRLEEGGPRSDDIKKALGSSTILLDIQKFIEVVKFEMDPIMTNYFWQVIFEEKCMHLSASLLNCLGYEGDLRIQQQHVKRFLKTNNVKLLELSTDDPRIEQYPSIEIEINEMSNKGAVARRKWFIVEPREFKKVIMKLNTKNGDKIREYYIRLEELIKSYMGYVLYFNDRESKIKLQQSDSEIMKLRKMIEESDQKLTHLISCAKKQRIS